MAFQYADQVASYMRVLIDDPNQVFLSQSRLATLLEAAYDDFRHRVPDEVWELTYQPAVQSAAYTLELNGVLFGAAATQTRAERISRVMLVDATTGRLLSTYRPTTSFAALGQLSATVPAPTLTYDVRWWLDGTVLRFSGPVSGTIQIRYLPQQTFNWTTGVVPGANQYLDDLLQFHDVIALLGAQQYAMADGKGNPKIDERLALRLADMEAFFAPGRSGEPVQYVQDVVW